MRILTGRWITALATAGAYLTTVAPVPAQTNDLTEIIVTARKRDETFQNVPITVAHIARVLKSAPKGSALFGERPVS